MSNPEQRILDAIAELEALESPDEIDRTVLWQLQEGRQRRGRSPAVRVYVVLAWERVQGCEWNPPALQR
jgi:hypothetical protein